MRGSTIEIKAKEKAPISEAVTSKTGANHIEEKTALEEQIQERHDSYYDHISIKSDGSRSTVTINGNKISGVRSYRLEHSAHGIPMLHLDLNGLNVTVDGEFKTVLPEIYQNFIAIKD